MAENVGVPTHLITGKAGSAHVTSSDVRKFNRCYSGYGDVYRLADPLDASWTVPITHETLRTIKIGYGSIMWNGMHIRNQEEQIIEFSDTVGWKFLCLHYVKNNSTGVESVEWIIIPDTEPTQRRSFKDNITNAYVTYYKWYYDGEANTQQTQVVGLLRTGKTRDDEIAAANTRIGRTNDVVTLATIAGGINEGSTVTLSESFQNFKMIGFVGNGKLTEWVSTSDISVNTYFYIQGRYAYTNFFDITQMYVCFPTTNKFKCLYVNGSIRISLSSATISKQTNELGRITKIIGMGRIV